MKTMIRISKPALLLVSWLLFSVMPAHAQQNEIPNFSFESWGLLDPDGWFSSNNEEGAYVNVEQVGDAQLGSSAARLTVVQVPNLPFGIPPGLETCPGGCRDDDNSTEDLIFPVSGRHGALCGYYKSSLIGGDLLLVGAGMLVGEEAAGGSVTSAGGSGLIAQDADDWTTFVVPIVYITDQTPTDGFISFAIVGGSYPDTSELANVGSVAILDNLFYCNLNGTPVGEENGDGEGSVLLIIDDADNPSLADQTVRDLLEDLDFEVMIVSDQDAETADADEKALLVISGSIDPNDLSADYSNTTVPLLLWEPALYHDLRLTNGTDFGMTTGVTTLSLLDANHPIANGFAGDATVYTEAAPMAFGQPVGGGRIVGSGGGQITIFTYDVGAAMESGTAPARRVGFFMDEDGPAHATIDGMVLLENAILWAAGREEEIMTSISVEQASDEVPGVFALGQNYPNPFNPATVIPFEVQHPAHVSLTVYDVLGRVVATLVNRTIATGSYTVDFEAADLPSGVYFYQLQAGGVVQSRAMLLHK